LRAQCRAAQHLTHLDADLPERETERGRMRLADLVELTLAPRPRRTAAAATWARTIPTLRTLSRGRCPGVPHHEHVAAVTKHVGDRSGIRGFLPPCGADRRGGEH